MVRGVQQLDMFDDTPEKVSLYMTMDKLRKRFGRNAIRRASGIEPRTQNQGTRNEELCI